MDGHRKKKGEKNGSRRNVFKNMQHLGQWDQRETRREETGVGWAVMIIIQDTNTGSLASILTIFIFLSNVCGGARNESWIFSTFSPGISRVREIRLKVFSSEIQLNSASFIWLRDNSAERNCDDVNDMILVQSLLALTRQLVKLLWLLVGCYFFVFAHLERRERSSVLFLLCFGGPLLHQRTLTLSVFWTILRQNIMTYLN